MVVLEYVLALSPDIKKIDENQTLEGYNASWLWENSSLISGKIPSDFHSPQIFDGMDGGGDCLFCHGKDGFSEKKIISLGAHGELTAEKITPVMHAMEEMKGVKTIPQVIDHQGTARAVMQQLQIITMPFTSGMKSIKMRLAKDAISQIPMT